MYTKYCYYKEETGNPIYFSIIPINKYIEVSLYEGKNLVKRKSLNSGMEVLKNNDVSLKVQIGFLKATPELRINNKIVVPQKLKRKELRNKLEELGINNEINPIPVPSKPFDFKSLKVPMILLVIGLIWETIIIGKHKLWEIPSILILILAYIMMFGNLIDRIPDRHMNQNAKSQTKLVVGILGAMLTKTIFDKIVK